MSTHPMDGSGEGEAPSHLSAGFLVGGGRHTLLRQIARGGMGVVWLAHDERLNESVALKFLSTAVRNDATELARLRQETQKSRKLTHANIIRIYDLYEEPGEPAFISMEYVNGLNLWELAAQQAGGIFTWANLRPLVKQMCEALAYAHGERVIHRDIKPNNLMLAENQRIKLADFGMATVAMQVDPASVEPVFGGGTLTHMSPQQLAGKVAVETDDIYSLGATLYELLCGHPPFYKDDIRHQLLHTAAPSLQQRLAALPSPKFVPKEVADTIMACLAKDPSKRPQSASAVAEWIGLADKKTTSAPVVASTVFSAPKASLPKEAPPRGQVWRWWIGAGLLACVGVVFWLGLRSSLVPLASPVLTVPTNALAMTTNAAVSERVPSNNLNASQVSVPPHSPDTGPSPQPQASVPLSPALSSSGKLRVISAVYGSGEHFADVTARVEEMMRVPSPEFFTNPNYLHADPTPGWNKILVLVYELNGRRHIFTAGEHGEVNVTRLMEQAKNEK